MQILNMNIKSSLSKNMYIGILLALLSISFVIYSLLLTMCPKKEIEEYDDEEFYDPEYMEYFDTQFKVTFRHIDHVIFIKNRVKQLNKDQHIYNQYRYGPIRKKTFVIVITVHDNLALLKELVKSLRDVTGIKNSLLIFSHEYYDENINKIISRVNFTKFIQLYYPYNDQLYQDQFPGDDPQFCTGDFNCTNTKGVRKHTYVQRKHFWWWQMNFIFDHVKILKDFDNAVAFLEDNQFVLKDVLYILKIFESLMPEHCPQCEMISLGNHAPNISQFHPTDTKVFIEPWDPSVSNYGIAFNRSVWNSIKNHSAHFCQFEDYRWDVSLQYLASKRPQGWFMMFSCEAPRALRINICDGSIADCTLVRSIEGVKRFAQSIHRGLFPQNLIISAENRRVENITAAGDWNDVRDLALCKHFTEMSVET